jgi:hypothetical protein
MELSAGEVYARHEQGLGLTLDGVEVRSTCQGSSPVFGRRHVTAQQLESSALSFGPAHVQQVSNALGRQLRCVQSRRGASQVAACQRELRAS